MIQHRRNEDDQQNQFNLPSNLIKCSNQVNKLKSSLLLKKQGSRRISSNMPKKLTPQIRMWGLKEKCT